MPNVGGTYYSRIDNHPACAVDWCRKKVERRGGSIMSSYCLEHTRDELGRLMAGGMAWHEARRAIWEARPIARLVFVP